MPKTLRELFEVGSVTPVRHAVVSSTFRFGIDRGSWLSAPLCALGLIATCKVHAQIPSTASSDADSAPPVTECLPDGSGYLRARLRGAIDLDLDWGNRDTGCTGAVRPTDGGLRVRFTRQLDADGMSLVLVFGIAGLHEGAQASALPVNVTVIREGNGEFFSTQGDDKCTLDRITQTPLVGIPHRARTYRIEARGFCSEPARALRGKGSILISRFDFAGRVNFDEEDTSTEPGTEQRAPQIVEAAQ